MITLYTIGFTKKSAEQFFNLLREHHVRQLVDVRISNSSQLAGFAKGKDLAFFVHEICHIPYWHNTDFAPTKELLERWHKHEITWNEYEAIYNKMLDDRKIIGKYDVKSLDCACFLCSEDTTEFCHRRLLVEYLQKHSSEEVAIIHLK